MELKGFFQCPAGQFTGVGVKMKKKLDAGDEFPALTIEVAGGGFLNIPGDMDGKYRIIMFYRGHW